MASYSSFILSITHSQGVDARNKTICITPDDCTKESFLFAAIKEAAEVFMAKAPELNHIFALQLIKEGSIIHNSTFECFDKYSIIEFCENFPFNSDAESEYAFLEYVHSNSMSFSEAKDNWEELYYTRAYSTPAFVEEYLEREIYYRGSGMADTEAGECLDALTSSYKGKELLWDLHLQHKFEVIDCPQTNYYLFTR